MTTMQLMASGKEGQRFFTETCNYKEGGPDTLNQRKLSKYMQPLPS